MCIEEPGLSIKQNMLDESYFKHAKALVETVHVGKGTRIWAFAHVLNGARIGEECNICDNVFVESRARVGNHVTIKNGVSVWDCVVIEDGVFVGPNAVFTNDKNPRVANRKPIDEFLPTVVREGASIGANATIICGVEIGRYAFVGAGAVVTKSVADYVMVAGNPAQPIGHMCACGERIGASYACKCGRSYVLLGEGLAPSPTEPTRSSLGGSAFGVRTGATS